MALVKFVTASAADYAALSAKDEGTLYFITDSRTIYKGSTPYSGGIFKAVTEFPSNAEDSTAKPEVNTIYVNTTNGEARFFNGTDYVVIVKPSPGKIADTPDNNTLATQKAVADYVTSKLANIDLSPVTSRLDTIEGTGDGSIKKAASDAQAAATTAAATYTDSKVKELSDGQVTTNKNDIAALTTTVDGKADKATTLSGYGIADAYTKIETDSKIAAAVANAHHLKRQIVDALPAVADADADTIYMVPNGGASGNAYDEYILVSTASAPVYNATENVPSAGGKFAASKVTVPEGKTIAVGNFIKDPRGNYNKVTAVADEDGNLTVAAKEESAPIVSSLEKIGSSEVDLTNYATKSYADTAASNAQKAATTAAATDATSKADKALTDAKAYADGLAANYATADQGAKADSALQAADIKTGAAGVGTISVKGTDVAVHGLGDIASHAASEFATAAQGKKADSAVQSIVESATNGNITVDGAEVAVHGLGSAAFTESTAYDKSGAAAAAQSAAEKHADDAVATLKSDIEAALTWGTL